MMMNQVAPDPDGPSGNPNLNTNFNTQWMQPQQVPGCAPCLAPLATLDLVIIQEESVSIATSRRKNFKLYNSEDCLVYEGNKDLNPGSFHIALSDTTGQDAIKLDRDYKFCGNCSAIASFRGPEISIDAPSGTNAGQLSQNFSLVGASFKLECFDGPTLQISSQDSGDRAAFVIKQEDSNQRVGSVRRGESQGLLNRLTSAKCIEVNFSVGLDPKVKACILGSAFYLSDRFYEKNSSQTARRRRGRRH